MFDFTIVKQYCGDQDRISAADVAAAVRDLQSRSNWHGVQIFPDAKPAPDGVWQFPRLSVGWIQEGDGYLVQCFESVDSRSNLLVTRTPLSEPEILMTLGLCGWELWPRQCFVPYERTLQAILHFIEKGPLDPSLAWVGLNDVPRRPGTRASQIRARRG
jgi:hypothetical protein